MKIMTMVLSLLGFVAVQAQDLEGLKPLRFEVVNIYHMNGSAIVEWCFPLANIGSLGINLGGSYGMRDAFNSLSTGVIYYPFNSRGVGFLAELESFYGFDLPSIQESTASDTRISVLAGYCPVRVI